MAKITFLGTASSIPTKTRDNTSFLFSHNNQTFLIDCPGAIVQKLLKIGYDFKKLQHVIITHHHPDHIYGVISLIHTQAYLNDFLTIYTNSQCKKLIQQLTKAFDLNRKQFPKISFVNVHKHPCFYTGKNFKLYAIKNNHAPGSFGIKFVFGKKSLFYSSDTAFSAKMLKQCGPLNYLIHDCTASSTYFAQHPALYTMHTDAKTLAEYSRGLPHTTLIPVHFLLLDSREEQRIRTELAGLKRQVWWVNDFDTIRL